MIKEALILAAGKGTRMWPLTENYPKPLLPLCGKPIIELQIAALRTVGVSNINILKFLKTFSLTWVIAVAASTASAWSSASRTSSPLLRFPGIGPKEFFRFNIPAITP